MYSKINEINIEDLLADVNLEIDEINSIIKIMCYASESTTYSKEETESISNVLFMLQGKLNNVKNKLKWVSINREQK